VGGAVNLIRLPDVLAEKRPTATEIARGGIERDMRKFAWLTRR